jgi:FkbM family methyltransferase
VLKPGGKLSMEMPDIEALCKSFLASTNYYEKMGILNAVYGSVNTTDVGGPDEITSPHLFGWWPESMFHHLQAAGFMDISFPPEQWPHPHNNMRVEAYKPALKIDREYLRAQDKDTFREIFEDDSYGLTVNDIRGKTVIDIGGNIGLYALFCAEKGANRVITVEAQPVIFKTRLLDNVTGYPCIEPLNYAASDTDGEMVHILNINVGSVVGGDEGDLVETITLSSLLDKCNVIGNDLVMKIDCEGSEFNILLTSTIETLRRFSVMSMEVHANTNPNPAYQDISLLEAKMLESGFTMVKTGRVFYDYSDGTRKWVDVYTNKWVRI